MKSWLLWPEEDLQSDLPSWFYAGKNTPGPQLRRVLVGMHPLGGHLGPEDSTCGTCAHKRVRVWPGRWIKCAKTTMSRCVSSDIRAKWRGCAQWEQAEIEP